MEQTQNQENTQGQTQNQENTQGHQSGATQRREHIKNIEQRQKVTMSRIAITSIETVKNNADLGMGTITDILAGAVCVLISNGSYLAGSLCFLVYALLCIFKHQVPSGPISIWLKKPVNEIVKDTEKAIKDITETFSRERIK